MKPIRIVLVAVLALTAVVGSAVVTYKTLRWKRFAVVEPGHIYRSGQLEPWKLRQAIARYGLRTVICLNRHSALEEKQICEELGVDFLAFDMPSDGRGNPADYERIVRLLSDPGSHPVLVHCQAGVARTGTAIALYRIRHHGRSTIDAIEELSSFGKLPCSPELCEHIHNMTGDTSEVRASWNRANRSPLLR